MKKLYLVALFFSLFCNIFPQTWQVQSPKPAGVALYDVVSLSATRVLAFGMAGKEMISTDAGETWNANTNLDIPNDIWGSYFLSDNTTGWIVGTGGKIMKTTDAGDTWVSQTSGTSNQLFDIEFSTANTNIGMAVGDLGTVLTTTDAGNSWVSQTSPGTSPFGPIYKVAIVPGSTTDVWIGNNNSITSTPREKLFKSSNFGTSWTNMTPTTPTQLTTAVYSIYIKDASNLWIGVSSGGIRVTTNGGTSWTNPQASVFQIYDVKLVSPTKILGVQAQGIVYSGTLSAGTWTWSPTLGTQTSTIQQLRAICYNIGYIILVGNAGNIFKSIDGGSTWVAKYITCDQSFTRSIIFKDDNHGWVGDQVGNLWKTTDGGANWSVLHNFNTSTTNQIYYMSMPSANIWYIACDHTLLYKTTDAGNTFSQITTTGITGTSTTFWSIAFADDQNGMVGTNGGKVLKTTDGGSTWTDISTSAGFGTGSIMNMEVQGASTYYLCGGPVATGRIVKTTDGGANFSLLSPPFTGGNFYTVKFKDKNIGLLGALNGPLQRTTDGGATWSSVTSPTTGTIYSFVFSGSNVWLCAGNGDIAHSTDDGATWSLDKKLTSNILYCMAISNNNLWVSGGEGTILKGTISSHAITLNLKAFFEGPTNDLGTVMENDVYPLTVKIQLYNTDGSLKESQTGNLSSTGIGTFTFTSAENGIPYYIVVSSSQILETQSATSPSFSNGLLSYDFTTGLGQAYTDGGGVDPMIKKGAVWCFYSGDVNQDMGIDLSDIIAVSNDNLDGTPGIFSGLPTDVNGDGGVDLSDIIIVNNNNVRGVYSQLSITPSAKKYVRPNMLQLKVSQ